MTQKTKIIAALLFLGMSTTGIASTSNPCSGVNIDFLRKHVPVPPAEIVSKRPTDGGLCEVILKINEEYVPVYTGSTFVIAGEMFKNRHQVTQERIAKLKAENFVKLRKEADKLVAFVYKPKGKIKHTLYMFTDPVCPFCHKAEENIKQIADEYHTQVKFIFFPVHIPAGREKAIEPVCRKLDAETYLKGDWKKDSDKNSDKYQCEKGKKLLEDSARLARRLGIRGVPTFFLENGKML